MTTYRQTDPNGYTPAPVTFALPFPEVVAAYVSHPFSMGQTPSDWTDAHIPRTERPVRFRWVAALLWADGAVALPRRSSIS